MTTTFAGVTLPHASKLNPSFPTLTLDTVLITGKHSIQTSPHTGFNASFRCLCTWDEVAALMVLIGTSGTLVTNGDTYTDCYISGSVKVTESDNPSYFYVDLEFVRDTS